MWPVLSLASVAAQPLAVHRTLDNGLVVVVLEDHREPLVAVEVSFAMGAAEAPGSAHLLEHLMFEGALHYDALLAEAGGDSNAWTRHGATAFTAVGPPGALERMLWLEAARMAAPLAGVSAADLDNQLAVIAAEIAQEDGRAAAALAAALYPPGHPLARPVLSPPDPVSLADLQVLAAAGYSPAGAMVVIGGDVDADEAMAVAVRLLAPLPARPVLPQVPAAPARPGPAVIPLPAATLVAWPTVPAGHADEPALELLVMIVAASLGEEGWASGDRLGGRLVLSLQHTSLREVRRVVRRIRRRPPDPVALARQQLAWRVWYLSEQQDLEDAVAQLSRCLREREAPDCRAAALHARQAVTPAQITAAARAYLPVPR